MVLALNLNANTTNTNYILNTSGLIDERAFIKINEIGAEVKDRLNINIYLDVKGDNGINIDLSMREKIKQMKAIEKELVSKLLKPYVVLTLALDQKYSNILFSDDSLKKIIDRDDILDGYVIPLLAAKDKNTLMSKVSAASFNGYAQIGDSIADSKKIELVSSIGSQGKIASTIWKMFMYTMVIIGIVSYFFIILKEKKYKKEFYKRKDEEKKNQENVDNNKKENNEC
jgi:ABC-type antimicrobial peptide transport system permease subunit